MRFLTISFLFIFVATFSQKKNQQFIDSKIKCIEVIGANTRINQRIVSKKTENDTLTLEVQYINNCGMGALSHYSIHKDTISLFTASIKDYADCLCVFNSLLKLKNSLKKNPIIKLDNFELKHSDSYYLPAHYQKTETDSVLVYDANGHHFRRTYYETGKIKSIDIRKNSYSEIIVYYENGRIKSTRQSLPDFDNFILKEWDENGNLINFENNIEIGAIFPTQEQQNEGALLIISKSKNDKQN
jgi:antitoxin component YwqK of YwqJK toxin-antitoxin module